MAHISSAPFSIDLHADAAFPMHPVLFLAYDGCLHAEGVRHTLGEAEHHGERHSLFEYAGVLAKLLEPYPEVRIVLSTPWSRIHGLEQAKAFLPAGLRSRVVGMTHEFCGDFVEWAGLTEFDQIMRYVDGHGIRHWLALSCDRYYWPEAFQKNRIWLTSRVGLGEDRAQVELTNKLKQLRHEWQALPASHISSRRDADVIRLRLQAAETKLADANISQLSASTRFQAAYDAVCCCAGILRIVEPQLVGLSDAQLFEELNAENLDVSGKDRAVALVRAWNEADDLEPRRVKQSDVDSVLSFAEAVVNATKRGLPGA